MLLSRNICRVGGKKLDNQSHQLTDFILAAFPIFGAKYIGRHVFYARVKRCLGHFLNRIIARHVAFVRWQAVLFLPNGDFRQRYSRYGLAESSQPLDFRISLLFGLEYVVDFSLIVAHQFVDFFFDPLDIVFGQFFSIFFALGVFEGVLADVTKCDANFLNLFAQLV